MKMPAGPMCPWQPDLEWNRPPSGPGCRLISARELKEELTVANGMLREEDLTSPVLSGTACLIYFGGGNPAVMREAAGEDKKD